MGSITREDHFGRIASAPASPSLRIMVVTQSGGADNVASLLRSLSKVDYDKDAVALDVWMFFSSTCDYLPLPVYPLAMAVFGPPRFDHSIPPAVHDVKWEHGEKTLIAERSEPNWSKLWEPNRGTANESLLFFDASLTTAVSPAFYVWLKKAQLATERGMIANAGILSLDPISIPDGVPASDRAVLLEQFFPSTAAFAPTQDVWTTFLKWHSLRRKRWFATPSLPKEFALGGYDRIDALRIDPARAWFAQFLATYRERIVYPVLPGNQTLLLRSKGSTGKRLPGVGGDGPVQIHFMSELETSLFGGNLKDEALPERPVLIKPNGDVGTPDAPFGFFEGKVAGKTRGAHIEDLLEKHAAMKYRDVLRHIADFARSRGSQSISLTMTTRAFLDTTLSWLCNVIFLDIAPPAIVIVAGDDKVADALTAFIKQHKRLEQGSLVISLQDAVKAVAYASSPDAPLHFGFSEYWMFMLQRTFLIRDLLERGLSILQFETDQIWLSDPMPYIRHELQNPLSLKKGVEGEQTRTLDMIITLNTRREVAGNFFFARPTIGTRNIFSKVVDRFFVSYQASLNSRLVKEKKYHYIANDQSLLTTLILEHDWVFSHRFPAVKYSVLNEQLFVDGTWFLDFEDEQGRKVSKRKHYTSETSLYPVLLNNNFLVGIEEKMKRAQRFGFWFLKKSATDLSPVCDEVSIKKAARSGSDKEFREAPVVEIGRTNGAI